MEGENDPSVNIPPDKPKNSKVIAVDATTKSKTTESFRNAGNRTVTKESEPATSKADTEQERVVCADCSDNISGNDEEFV